MSKVTACSVILVYLDLGTFYIYVNVNVNVPQLPQQKLFSRKREIVA